MLREKLAAIVLSLPLLVLFITSISYWVTYRKKEKEASSKQQIGYNMFYLTLVGIGYFSIWPIWLGGIVLLFLEKFGSGVSILMFHLPKTGFVQIAGLVILYTGSLLFAWSISYARKYLRPSTSGIHEDHELLKDGPLGIVRHPYYVSYVLILIGLSLALTSWLPLIFTFSVIAGMGPAARAEEVQLKELFGEEYEQYEKKVGRFFPKL